jgi:hypothetical protein
MLRLGLLQDGDVGVGVLPEREEVLIFVAGLGGIALQDVGSRESDMGERANGFVADDAGVVEDFWELGGCGGTVLGGEIGLDAQVNGI